MKKALSLVLFTLTVSIPSFAQKVTSEPVEYTDPTQPLKIIVNLALLDQSNDHTQNLIQMAQNDSDLYIWTWKPREHGPGSPKVNGLGATPWKNSNPILKMTKEADLIYSYSMIPVEFYEVTPAEVFTENIHFLVKPRDGGGYGDPDIKSEDLMLRIDPPVSEKPAAFGFPSKIDAFDFFTLVYDNNREEKESMQNIAPDNCFVYIEGLLQSGQIVRVTNFFLVGTNPELRMQQIRPGVFEKSFIPYEILNLQAGDRLTQLKCIVMKGDYVSGADRRDEDVILETICE